MIPVAPTEPTVQRGCSIAGCDGVHAARGYCMGHYNRARRYGSPTASAPAKPTPAERFWAKVDRSGGPGACWPWTSALDRYGYGVFGLGIKRRSAKAHRVAWELTNGLIPEGLWVLHHCDNPPCCNPAHLYLGTGFENNRDTVVRGRRNQPDRDRNPQAKLTSAQVAEIRARHRTGGIRLQELARQYGVTRSTIRYALHGPRRSVVPINDPDGGRRGD